MGDIFCTALQKADIRSLLPTWIAVIIEKVSRIPAAGTTEKPSLVRTSATSRPPLRDSPVVWGPRKRPEGGGGGEWRGRMGTVEGLRGAKPRVNSTFIWTIPISNERLAMPLKPVNLKCPLTLIHQAQSRARHLARIDADAGGGQPGSHSPDVLLLSGYVAATRDKGTAWREFMIIDALIPPM